MRSQIESGAELLARLRDKRSLRSLDETLFGEGLRSTDIVEIVGSVSTGKTVLLSQLLAKCVLPSRYEDFQIEGCDASAILINTDHHFEASKLVELMTGILSSKTIDAAMANVVVRRSLRNLLIIDCYDSEQFFLTLRTLDNVLMSKANIALLAIDGIAAYYWEDHENNAAATVNLYVEKVLKLVRNHTSHFNVTTIYTRSGDTATCDAVSSCSERGRTRGYFGKHVDYRIALRSIAHTPEMLCKIETASHVEDRKYTILPSGIHWTIKR